MRIFRPPKIQVYVFQDFLQNQTNFNYLFIEYQIINVSQRLQSSITTSFLLINHFYCLIKLSFAKIDQLIYLNYQNLLYYCYFPNHQFIRGLTQKNLFNFHFSFHLRLLFDPLKKLYSFFQYEFVICLSIPSLYDNYKLGY